MHSTVETTRASLWSYRTLLTSIRAQLLGMYPNIGGLKTTKWSALQLTTQANELLQMGARSVNYGKWPILAAEVDGTDGVERCHVAAFGEVMRSACLPLPPPPCSTHLPLVTSFLCTPHRRNSRHHQAQFISLRVPLVLSLIHI